MTLIQLQDILGERINVTLRGDLSPEEIDDFFKGIFDNEEGGCTS